MEILCNSFQGEKELIGREEGIVNWRKFKTYPSILHFLEDLNATPFVYTNGFSYSGIYYEPSHKYNSFGIEKFD